MRERETAEAEAKEPIAESVPRELDDVVDLRAIGLAADPRRRDTLRKIGVMVGLLALVCLTVFLWFGLPVTDHPAAPVTAIASSPFPSDRQPSRAPAPPAVAVTPTALPLPSVALTPAPPAPAGLLVAPDLPESHVAAVTPAPAARSARPPSVAGASTAPAPIPFPAAPPLAAPLASASGSASASPSASTTSEPAGGEGFLNVNSIPASLVVLDGKPIGSTPKVHVQVAAGPHTVVFTNSELGVMKEVSITVGAGETKVATAKLRE